MANLYVPIGMPGCGKSFFYETFLDPAAYLASTDAIRLRLCGDENDQSKNNLVFDTFHEDIAKMLAVGQDVYADATNLHLFARDKLKACTTKKDKIHYILFRNGLQALKRNRERERKVPDGVMMYKMLPAYEKMLMVIFQEQCDTLTEIRRF